MKFFSNRSNNGFTLLELMVAMTIGLIVILGTAHILISSRLNQAIQQQQKDIQRQGQDLSNILKRYIKNLGSNMCLAFQYDQDTTKITKTSSKILVDAAYNPNSLRANTTAGNPFTTAMINAVNSGAGEHWFLLNSLGSGTPRQLPKSFSAIQLGTDNASYTFFTRSGLLTQEVTSGVLTGRMSAYAHIFTSNCTDQNELYYPFAFGATLPVYTFTSKVNTNKVFSSGAGEYNLPLSEVNVFEYITLTYMPITRTLRMVGAAGGDRFTIARNISAFQVSIARPLSPTDFKRDSTLTWEIFDPVTPSANIPYRDTPVAIKISFTIDPPAAVANNNRLTPQTFEVVAAVRTKPSI